MEKKNMKFSKGRDVTWRQKQKQVSTYTLDISWDESQWGCTEGDFVF